MGKRQTFKNTQWFSGRHHKFITIPRSHSNLKLYNWKRRL